MRCAWNGNVALLNICILLQVIQVLGICPFLKYLNCVLNSGKLCVNNVNDCQQEILERRRKRIGITPASYNVLRLFITYKFQPKSKIIEMIRKTCILRK